MTNDTPNNVLCSFALFGKGTCRSMRIITDAAKSGEINLMFDSGAFSAFNSKGYDFVTLDNYCRWLAKFGDCAEKYIMLDVIGNEEATKANLLTMRKRGFDPMYVYTMASKDEAFMAEAVKGNPNICVAGGATTKGDWLVQRYQRVLKLTGGKARIHGLAFVTFPKMLQCGLASVDSSSWAVAPMKFAGIPVFISGAGIKMLDRRRLVAGLKKRDPLYLRLANELRLTLADVQTEEHYHTTSSIPFYAGVRAYMSMQRYCYRRGLRLFFAIANSMNQLYAIQYWNRHWTNPSYTGFRTFVEQMKERNSK